MGSVVVVALAACLLVGASYLVARALHVVRLRAMARQRLNIEAGAQRAASAFVGRIFSDSVSAKELAAYGSLTVAEFAWSWFTIDPELIRATDFASTGSVTSGFGFAEYIHDHFSSLPEAAKAGFVSRLSGYVAEQHVAALLDRAGHIVRVAEAANQPVWDLVVDGHMANVKDVAHTASILHDAMAHPDVTYIVPEGVHGTLAPNIETLDGFHHGAAAETVKEGIAAGKGEAALHGIGMHFPFVTVGFAGYRNWKLVRDHGQDSRVAFQHAIIESVGHGSGVVVGAKLMGMLGMIFGPLVGVALAVFGAIFGRHVGGRIANWFKLRPLVKAIGRFHDELGAFGKTFQDRLRVIREYVRAPLTRMTQARRTLEKAVQQRRGILRHMIWPDFYTVLLEEAEGAAEAAISEYESSAQGVLSIIDAAERRGEWLQLGALMTASPTVRQHVGYDRTAMDRVVEAQRQVHAARKALNPSFQPPRTMESATA